jgi:hypothetical protein
MHELRKILMIILLILKRMKMHHALMKMLIANSVYLYEMCQQDKKKLKSAHNDTKSILHQAEKLVEFESEA